MKILITNKSILQFLGVILLVILFSYSCNNKSNTDQKATNLNNVLGQQTGEWISLFDGESLDGWKRYNANKIGPLWSVENGSVKCDGKGHGEGSGENGGSLITIKTFGNFEMEIDWKISEKGNSGILYHVVEKPEYSHAYITGPEYQITDDGLAKNKNEYNNKKTGSSYDMYAAPPLKKLNPVMEWNSSKIIYNRGKVEHWLNGEKVVEFDENSLEFKERYNKSKWSSEMYPVWNFYKVGSIALQDHGAEVWYKNIRIRKL